MKKVEWFFCFFLILFVTQSLSSALESEIIEVNNFAEINFDTIPSKSLIVLDIDDVLIRPKDGVGQHAKNDFVHQTFVNYIAKQYRSSLQEKFYHYASIMQRDMENEIIDPSILEKIKTLHDRKITVIGLTSSRIGKYGLIESIEKTRHEELQKFGFTWSFDDETTSFEHLKVDEFPYVPQFYKGIIFVARYSKGDGLDAFLTWKNIDPVKIFFFDDYKDHLISVQNVCCRKKIPFQGYHYVGSIKNKRILNPELMHKQFDCLLNKGIWLNDQNAETI